MSTGIELDYNRGLIEDISARFGLRQNNRDALDALVRALHQGRNPAIPAVMDMATGSGKTYLMAAFIEYLRAHGIGNVMVITPSLVVQTKTVRNFSYGSSKFIPGSDADTTVVTPDDYGGWTADDASASLFHRGKALQLFVFNVQQLLAPKDPEGATTGNTAGARQTRIRRFMESTGNLFEYLRDSNDLVVIADEHHLYGPSAKAFRQAITDLQPAAVVGLTASASKDDDVVFRYPLYQAIADGHVKKPVLAFRKGGYGPLGEEQQLRDALTLLRGKARAYQLYVHSHPEATPVNPVLFVVCTDVAHATATATLLRSSDMLGSASAVLQVDNAHNDIDTMKALDNLDTPDSPVRAVVSVNKLKEGWDVRSIAVMVTLRAMTSDILTQQTMGRGLRLPFGAITGQPAIDQLDIVGHDSFRKLLKEENVLRSFGLAAASRPNATPRKLLSAGATDTGTTSGGSPDAPSTAGSRPEGEAREEWDFGGVAATVLDDDADVVAPLEPEPQTVSINDTFAGTVVTFPRTTMTRDDSPFDLIEITDAQLSAAAARITSADATMEREEIITTAICKHLALGTRAVEQADVDALPVDSEDVTSALTAVVFNSALVERNSSNLAQTRRRIVPVFMNSSGITQWTEVTATSAAVALRELIHKATIDHTKRLTTKVTVHPHKIPLSNTYLLPAGETIHDRIDDKGRTAFVPRRHYGTWDKGAFTAAAFDSYSAEYRIAELLNKAANIDWWMRLYDRDRAEIAYRINRTYRPDFLARDAEGVHWIIEGKAADRRDDSDVSDKRAAAESLIRRLVSVPEFQDQQWGYLVAYDDTVHHSASWNQLRDASEPISQLRHQQDV